MPGPKGHRVSVSKVAPPPHLSLCAIIKACMPETYSLKDPTHSLVEMSISYWVESGTYCLIWTSTCQCLSSSFAFLFRTFIKACVPGKLSYIFMTISRPFVMYVPCFVNVRLLISLCKHQLCECFNNNIACLFFCQLSSTLVCQERTF